MTGFTTRADQVLAVAEIWRPASGGQVHRRDHRVQRRCRPIPALAHRQRRAQREILAYPGMAGVESRGLLLGAFPACWRRAIAGRRLDEPVKLESGHGSGLGGRAMEVQSDRRRGGAMGATALGALRRAASIREARPQEGRRLAASTVER